MTESQEGWTVVARELAGAGDAQPIWTSAQPIGTIDWAPDGRSFIVQRRNDDGRRDIWQVPVSGGEQARPVLDTSSDEFGPRVSPDGRWLAYVSDETGQQEVYVRPMLGAGPSWRVSTEGGGAPRWSGTGRELFYRKRGDMYVVTMGDAKQPEPALPRHLFTVHDPSGSIDYSVDREGQRFVFVLPRTGDYLRKMPPITLLINWQERLRKAR